MGPTSYREEVREQTLKEKIQGQEGSFSLPRPRWRGEVARHVSKSGECVASFDSGKNVGANLKVLSQGAPSLNVANS
jgi:hypothetical protein